MKRFILSTQLFAALFIPLEMQDQWKVLSYSSVPAHKVSWSKLGLKLQVDSSASPLIYPLKEKKLVSKVSFKGKMIGGLNFSLDNIQGNKGFDDFVLRLGLVVPGSKRLSWFERKIAPNWVLKLQGLAPDGYGIDKVYFLNLASQKLDWRERNHPLSKFLVERIIGLANDEFQVTFELDKPLDVVAIWISSDGDDLKQKYEIILSELKLE